MILSKDLIIEKNSDGWFKRAFGRKNKFVVIRPMVNISRII